MTRQVDRRGNVTAVHRVVYGSQPNLLESLVRTRTMSRIDMSHSMIRRSRFTPGNAEKWCVTLLSECRFLSSKPS
ncbi:hypothetical protein ASG56_03720 [Rhodococcus sp. Leaf7]|nr:hypothetical protein ASG56_03720 [Rhodococcus sp. Leaf7]KQU42258.1 hypothetical protein ASG64_03720 [Rhodococcus sp. Leaf247]